MLHINQLVQYLMQKGENLSSILKPMVKKADYAGVSLIPGQADGDKHITRAC